MATLSPSFTPEGGLENVQLNDVLSPGLREAAPPVHEASRPPRTAITVLRSQAVVPSFRTVKYSLWLVVS